MNKEFFQKISCLFAIALTLVCSAIIIAHITGPANKEDDDIAQNNFELLTATIEEVSDNTLVVRPVKGEWELNSADKIVVNKNVANESIRSLLKAGTTIVIKYNGQIMESYPAQINADEIWIKSFDLFINGSGLIRRNYQKS